MSSITNTTIKPARSSTNDKNRVSIELGLFALPANWVLALLCVPMMLALGVSAYLSYASLTASEIAGCSGGEVFDCGHVVNSKYSKFLGIPVSLLAMGTYAAMLMATVVTASQRLSVKSRQWGWTAVTGLAIAAALAALYFIFLQVFVLKHLCQWCLAAHTCGLLIAATTLWYSRINTRRLFSIGTLAAAGLAVMVVAQVKAEEPQKYVIERYEPIPFPDNSGESTFTNDGDLMACLLYTSDAADE